MNLLHKEGDLVEIDATEIITYMMIIVFVIGIFYIAFQGNIIKKEGELKEGERVVGEKEIKESINRDVESIEDEVFDIGEMIK